MITVNKYKVNSLIPKAVEIIKDTFPNYSLSKTYSGYISSFSADCIMLTPLATAIMFESSSSSEENKSYIPEWIMRIINEEGNLSDYIMNNSLNGQLNKSVLIAILTAASALKIAIRKFKLD